MCDPVGEDNTTTRSQNPVSLAQRTFSVRDMKQRFLIDHHIDAFIGQRHLHDVAFDYANVVLQSHAARELCRSLDPDWCQFDAGDIGAKPVSYTHLTLPTI